MFRNIILLFVVCVLVSACSSPTDREEVNRLKTIRGEWTHEQTNDAIDLYLRGLEHEEELLEQNLEIQSQVNFFDEKKCSRDVLNERREEIEKARRALSDKRKRLENNF